MATLLGHSLPPSAIVIPVFSVSAVLLEIPSFIWHLKSRNYAAACMIVYFFFLQFMAFINAIIWPRDISLARFNGVGLCDVEIRFQLLAYIGIPGCIFCIMRKLAAILDTERAAVDEASKGRRRMFEDAFACVGFPIVINALYYIVQPLRYRVFTVSGCKWGIAYSWPSILVVQMWPIIFSLINAGLAVTVLYRLYKYSNNVSNLLSNSSTTKSRFMRLFTISMVLVLVVLPITIQALVIPIQRGYIPYDWHLVHYVDWSPELVPTGGRIGITESDAIMSIIGGFLVFLCFGIGKDAVGMYRGWAKKFGILRFLPCLQERSSAATFRPDDSLGSYISNTTTNAGHDIKVTTTYESKTEPNSPFSTKRLTSVLSSHFGSEKEKERDRESLDLCSNRV